MALYVCNNGETEFSDRYDGQDYVIPPGETIEMPVEAAKHIFGYGEGNRMRAFLRQGVMNSMSELPKAKKWLEQFKFEERSPPPPPDLAEKRRGTRAAQRLEASDVPVSPTPARAA